MSEVQLGGLTFDLRLSENRETLEIVVDREGELRFYAPKGCPESAMEAFVIEKRTWIYEKLAEKERLNPPRPPKRFVSGENFFYLGRTHRLFLVEDEDRTPLRLVNGEFRLLRSKAARGRPLFQKWYADRGKAWLPPRAEGFIHRMGLDGTRIRVMDLQYRWGSCTQEGVVNIHWAVMQIPPPIIDYVLVHELAHILEHDHGPEFWRVVERVLPDYADRKRWLAERGAELVRL